MRFPKVGKRFFVLLCSVLVLLTVTGFGWHFVHALNGGANDTGGHRQTIANNNGLLGHYAFDGDTYDSSNSGNDGTAVNTPTFVAGKFGQAMVFDGSSQYVTVGTSKFQYANDFTVSAWVNTATSGSTQNIFSTWGGRSWLYLDTSAKPAFATYDGSTFQSYTASTAVSPNTWHYIVGIKSSTTGVSLYLDGALIGTNAYTGSVSYAAGATNIGGYAYSSGGPYWFTGSIDDVRVYNRVLSTSEITQLYQGSKPVNCDQTCVSWWKLDESSGTTTKDTISGGNDGTLVGGSTWTSGVFANGLTFDNKASNSQYVSYGTNISSYKFGTGDFTIEGWINPSSYTSLGSPALFGVNAATTVSRYALDLTAFDHTSAAFFIKDDSGNN